MNIVPIIKKGNSCDYHRLYQPLKYLNVDVDTPEKLPILIKGANVVIFNRWAGFPIEHLLRAKKRYGFKIVCDLDDYFELYSNHIHYKSWVHFKMKQNILEAIFNSDMVMVTTTRLADVVKKLNKNIEIIPNGIPFGYEQFVKNQTESNRFQITYVGGISHFWDLLTIKNLFYKIARENIKKNITISLAGYSESNKESKELWTAMENICTASGRLSYIRKEGVPLGEYMNLYDGASVAIAPLEHNYFNSFKSNLKIIEAGCKEIPIIATNVPPYSDELSDTILKASSVNEWYNHIEYLSKNPEYTKDLGLKLGEYVREKYDLLKINEKRKQIFEYLCT